MRRAARLRWVRLTALAVCATGTSSVGAGDRAVSADRADAAPDRPVSFRNDVLPILSKLGCNAGGCHGKASGQGGFKLSVFGFDPKSDHTAIVTEARGRRVFPAAPDESLVLKKPTMRVAHEGGKRLERDSDAYRTLRRWIAQGTPYTFPDDPALSRLELEPAEQTYALEARQQLRVRAHYSDGTTRDVTHLTHFLSNDDGIAAIDEHGLLTVGKRSGEAVIVARFVGSVGIARVTVPVTAAVPAGAYATLPRNNFIDEHVYAKLATLGLLPSPGCTDAEFLRRAHLDAIGRLPSSDDARAFLADADPDKRNRLIDRLLDHPAYPDHWAVKWGDLVRSNPVRVGVKGVFMFDRWLRASFRDNKPYDRFVRDIVTAQGSTHRYGPAVLFRDRRDPAELTTLVSRIFLGVRIDCARCHHHPNEKWSQTDFYQLAAYFGQLKRKGAGIAPPISPGEEFFYHAPGGKVTHPVTGAVMKPTPPDGAPAVVADGRDPRQVLVDWMVEPDNPFFAHAIVNRVWAEFFGRGIVDPVDDFRASNPPTNGPLLDALAQDFRQHNFDLKHLMRTIMRSHVYQLSSLPNEQNVHDTQNYARAYRRRLPAEALLDAVLDATGTPQTLQGMPAGSRAAQAWNNRLASHFMDAFGRPNASADCPCERDSQTSVVQALHLMNAESLQKKIAHKEGRAARLAASDRPPDKIVEELYLATYNRLPTAEERSIATAAFTAKDATRQTAAEDVLWALLNSAEFVFNH